MDVKESKDGRGLVDRTGGIMVDRFALSNITVHALHLNLPVRIIPECGSKIETFAKVMHHFV